MAGVEKLAELEVRERQAAAHAEELAAEAARLRHEALLLQDAKDAADREQQESRAAVQVGTQALQPCACPGFQGWQI